jgi:hypothetical protein
MNLHQKQSPQNRKMMVVHLVQLNSHQVLLKMNGLKEGGERNHPGEISYKEGKRNQL